MFLFLALIPIEHQLWKVTADCKLVNKSVGINWVFGSKHWLIEDGFIVDQQTGKVLDIEGEVFSPGREVIVYPKHGGANQKWEVVPTDDWMKLRNPKSGLYLQLTNNGQGLTVEGKIHTVNTPLTQLWCARSKWSMDLKIILSS